VHTCLWQLLHCQIADIMGLCVCVCLVFFLFFKFCVLLGKLAMMAYEMLKFAFGKETLSCIRMYCLFGLKRAEFSSIFPVPAVHHHWHIQETVVMFVITFLLVDQQMWYFIWMF